MTAAKAMRRHAANNLPGRLGASVPNRDQLAALQDVAARYAVAITPAVAGMMDANDPHDPIARQFLPDVRELDHLPQEHADPIGDDAHSPVEGVVHRYPDRVLLKLVNACAVYCRFCFRREMVGPGRGGLSPRALSAALDYIAKTPQIWEVILTGGDPLVLSPRRLKDVMAQLTAIEHVKVIRVHTRVPTVAPARITPALVKALRTDKATFVVLHANHARELTKAARAACARLVDAGIPMLSQSVLLRGVNDDAGTLGELMRDFGRMPDQALLPAPCRSCARHGAFSHHHRGRSGADARIARPRLRTVPADLCARYSGRLRQIAGRADLSGRKISQYRWLRGRRLLRAAASLSATPIGNFSNWLNPGHTPQFIARSGRFGLGKVHYGLELIIAGFAGPSVPCATGVQIFRPVRCE